MIEGTYEDAVLTYRKFDEKCARTVYKYACSHDYETLSQVPSLDLKDEMEDAYKRLLLEGMELPQPDPVFSLLKSHFLEFLEGHISGVASSFENPDWFVGRETYLLDFNSRQDSRPAHVRLQVLSARLSQLDAVWEGVKSLFPTVHPDKIQETAQACKVLQTIAGNVASKVPSYYGDLDLDVQNDLAERLSELVSKARSWEAESYRAAQDRATLGDLSELTEAKIDPERYGEILSRELGVPLEELLEWYEEEIECTRKEMMDVARSLNLGSVESLEDVFKILDQYAGPCDTVEEMFSRMEKYVEIAKRATKDGFVNLPEEYCIVSPTPEQCRDSYPWGGYGGGCFRRRPLVGEVFLNDSNYKAVTDGWLKMMAIHECYPGHHVQFVRTTLDPLPETVKIGSRYIPLLEGTAHRSEKLMEHIFSDPVFPLFVRLRRHHTAVRIKADLWLHYFGRSVEEAVELYMKELGFDRVSARGQVRYQERNPGYMTCYYYGMKKIEALQEKFKYGDKEFTEILFSVGRLSLPNFERFLKLSQEDKVRFQKDFASLVT
ncbi:MAG TPA: DUF885 family protein [Bacillota bacterium]|nr:DUF885 family protein [Bacillota bacterium]